jgi:hypothetical protein
MYLEITMKVLLSMILAVSMTGCVTDELPKDDSESSSSDETEDGSVDQPTAPGRDVSGDTNNAVARDVLPGSSASSKPFAIHCC